MLEVQRVLRDGRTLDDLKSELGIVCTRHETLPLVILNYDQIHSPKLHPITRECRGLVLETGSWNLVARSMRRFFNWGEVPEEMDQFDFSDFVVQTKEDGSLALLYRYQGEWRINTRGAFAQDPLPFQSFSWEQGILRGLGLSARSELDRHLPDGVTYIAEFCSPWNKVVRRYEAPVMYLLTAFEGVRELSLDETDALARDAVLFRQPQRHHFRDLAEVQAFLAESAERDPTYEGVVLRDARNHRWKVKSPTYLGLHRLKGDGENLWNPKNLLPFILSGDTDELLTYFSEVKPALDHYAAQYERLRHEVLDLWSTTRDIPEQKEFALAVKPHRLSSVLFEARKSGRDPAEVLRGRPELLLKILRPFRDHPL